MWHKVTILSDPGPMIHTEESFQTQPNCAAVVDCWLYFRKDWKSICRYCFYRQSSFKPSYHEWRWEWVDPRGGDQMWPINVYKEKVVKEEGLTASTEWFDALKARSLMNEKQHLPVKIFFCGIVDDYVALAFKVSSVDQTLLTSCLFSGTCQTPPASCKTELVCCGQEDTESPPGDHEQPQQSHCPHHQWRTRCSSWTAGTRSSGSRPAWSGGTERWSWLRWRCHPDWGPRYWTSLDWAAWLVFSSLVMIVHEEIDLLESDCVVDGLMARE